MSQARDAVDLTLAERIKKYSFIILYKGEIGSEMGECLRPRKAHERYLGDCMR